MRTRVHAGMARCLAHARTGVVCTLLAAGIAQAEILKGPYVLLENAATLRIRFEVNRTDYTLDLWRGGGAAREAVPLAYRRSPRDTFMAEALVALSPANPLMGYEVGRAGEPGRRFEWRSRIDGTLSGYPRLVVFGDSQGGGATLARLAEQWEGAEPDLVVGLGDLTDTGSRYESWGEEFFGPLRDVLPHRPFLPICGNHDSYREKSLAWYDWFFGRTDGRRFFRIDFDDLRLIGLNNSDLHTKYGFDPIDPLTPQYEFLLESALGPDAQDRKLAIFCHVPIVSGSTVVNTEFGSALQRKYVVPILERARVLGFFAGHHHTFERVRLPGRHGRFQHIVSGGGGGRLFTSARERGGFTMDREVFEHFHYLEVDFSGLGSVVARALGGAEIDRVALESAAPPGTEPREAAFWRASVASDLDLVPLASVGTEITFAHAASPELLEAPDPRLLHTERGMVVVARDLAAAGSERVSFQGYDWPRRSWSYLQGGSLVLPVEQTCGRIAVISLNGADLSPLDVAFPVLHWPLAQVRAGLHESRGAMMLLRGREDFERDPSSRRLFATWRWGPPQEVSLADEQRDRQWSLLESSPANSGPERVAIADLMAMLVREGSPEGFVLRHGEDPPTALLLHWPKWRCLAVIEGESLARGTGSIFVSTATTTRIEAVVTANGLALALHRANAGSLLLPVATSAQREANLPHPRASSQNTASP